MFTSPTGSGPKGLDEIRLNYRVVLIAVIRLKFFNKLALQESRMLLVGWMNQKTCLKQAVLTNEPS